MRSVSGRMPHEGTAPSGDGGRSRCFAGARMGMQGKRGSESRIVRLRGGGCGSWPVA